MVIEMGKRIISFGRQLQNFSFTVLFTLCEFIFLECLEIIETILSFSESVCLLFICHVLKSLHLLFVSIYNVLVITAHGSIFEDRLCYVCCLLLSFLAHILLVYRGLLLLLLLLLLITAVMIHFF